MFYDSIIFNHYLINEVILFTLNKYFVSIFLLLVFLLGHLLG